MRTVFYILCISICFPTLYGQESDSLTTKYFESMYDKVAIEVTVNNSFESFKVITPALDFNIHPNAKTKLGLGMNYRFLSVGLQVAPNFVPGNDDNVKKGNTSFFEFGGNLVFKHWVSGLYYNRVKGYYLKNSNEFDIWEEGDPYIQFPDLKYSGVLFTLGYSSNENFSFASLLTQTERQLLSSGSFTPNLEFRQYTIGDTTKAPGTQKSANTEITVGPGYAYTFVLNKSYFLSMGGKAGIGYHYTKLTTRNDDGDIHSKQDNLLWRWEGALGLGHNGKRFYSGFYGVMEGGHYNQENTTARNSQTRLYFRAFVGYRFKAPSFLKKSVDALEKLLPF